MSSAVLYLVFLCGCSCSVAQFSVIQEAKLSVSLSTDVRMSCSRSAGSVAGDNYPNWFKQVPGEVPQLVVGSSGTGNQNWRPSWTSARFTGAILGGSSVLTISTVQATDEGDYYCALWAGSQWMFGGGTYLSVLGEIKPPTVSLFPPSTEEISTGKATFVCSMAGFSPRTVSVKWSVDGIEKTGETSLLSKQNDNTYLGSSYLTMTASEWQKQANTVCKVTHQGKDFIQTLKRSECMTS